MKERLKDRYYILGAVFILMGMIIITQLVNLQVIRGKELDLDSQKRLLNNRPIIAPRGNIEDRNGVPIAVNRMGFIVQIVKSGLDDMELNGMLLDLIKVLKKNGNSYNKSLNKYLTFEPTGYGYGYLVKKTKDPLKNLISELGIKEKDAAQLHSPTDVFNYLRKEKYKIDDRYTQDEAEKIMLMRFEIRNYGTLNPTRLAENVSKETVAELEERHHDFPGISTDIEPVRQYIDATDVAHVLGYIRGIDGDEYKKLKNEGYSMTDVIGKSGIELAAEKYLRGKDGQRRVEVDTEGRLTEELNSIPAVPGDKVVLTLDMKLQQVAMDSLKNNVEIIRNRVGITAIKANDGDASAGAAVVLDVHTGEVLAMASYPSYDPSIFLAGSDNTVAQDAITKLYADKNSPSMNRTIAARYEPGSTFKPVVAVAGMEEGVITPKTKINDPGHFIEEGVDLKCMEYANGQLPNGHGPLTVSRALATSCNIFFFKLGIELGINKIDKWAKDFGLGEYTGIEIGPESKGIRSNKEYHYEIYPRKTNNYIFGNVLTAYSSIGQLYNNYTLLQLANYTATIANDGKRFTPHLIKRIVKPDGTIEKETKPTYTQLPIHKETLDAVKLGMLDVANSSEGTAAQVFDDFTRNYHISVAGKTGTAQTPESQRGACSNNGLFICYAPADDPKVAIAVVIEKGAMGKFAAPVAKDILSAYFNLNSKGSVDDTATPDQIEWTR